MPAKCFGVTSLAADEEIAAESPRDPQRRGYSADDAQADAVERECKAILADPTSTPERRAYAEAQLDAFAYTVSVVPRKNGYRFVDGERVPTYKDDSDVLSHGRLAASIGEQIAADVTEAIGKLR